MDNGNIKIEQAPSWGSSVPVANVQEMARRNPLSVPNKYTRDLDDRPNLSPVSSDIPVIDLPLLSDGSNEEELKKLDLACKNWGFFQVPYNNTSFVHTNTDI
ncbi:hypothetical protein IFM89_003773 [Coptis chinensis]|uniref:Non-haem dioxygenase N-terminal domain-containing protein n=1 Tax=Coptis chinensis TaxID=261450 RepID=A0A835IBD9_9MAGN|nr:hypothetical protein IFM89_003773 [Coptis chinensis]